jgi:hypothetical protein
VTCEAALAAGTEVTWDSDSKTATCAACSGAPAPVDEPPPIDRGVAGASARRKYEKDASREGRRKEAVVAADAQWRQEVVAKHPILGRVATALTEKPVVGPESAKVRNWAKGADGEELVGPILEACPGVVVLHDRRIPRSKANIDHLVVAPCGIYVVDPKNYEGLVERRVVGGWLHPEERLYVNNRNQTKLVEGVLWQMAEVRTVLGDEPVPIHGALCFVGPNWRRFFARPLSVRGIPVLWPAKVTELVSEPGPLDTAQVTDLAARLAKLLRPA